MRIVIINGTEVKGCTYHMKESFLSVLRDGNEITEFYLPKDCPHFCSWCKTCFSKSEYLCPHAAHTVPISKMLIQRGLKNTRIPSADARHWLKYGWISQ